MEWRCKVEPPRLYRCLFGESRAIEYRVGSPRYSYCLLGVLSRKSLRRRAHSPHAISAVKRRQVGGAGSSSLCELFQILHLLLPTSITD